MSGFTPGPWSAVAQQGIGAPGWEIIGPNRENIATGPRWRSEHADELYANGELIAASPELLKQLERAEFLISNMANARLGPLSDGAQARLPEIRGAIAKARGES